MIGSGLFIGIFFDGYRVLKGKLSLHKLIVFFIDLAFGIISGVIAFYLLLLINHGQLRLVIPLFFVLGLIIYYLLFSKYVVKLWVLIYSAVSKIVRGTIKIFKAVIITPIMKIAKLLFLIISFLSGIIYSSLFFIVKIIKKPFAFLKDKKSATMSKSYLRRKEGFSAKLKKIFKK